MLYCIVTVVDVDVGECVERVSDKITDYVVRCSVSNEEQDCLLCYVTNVMEADVAIGRVCFWG